MGHTRSQQTQNTSNTFKQRRPNVFDVYQLYNVVYMLYNCFVFAGELAVVSPRSVFRLQRNKMFLPRQFSHLQIQSCEESE